MTDAVIARADQWLGREQVASGDDQARLELLRRFLRCYGPATPQAFAEWTKRSIAEVRGLFAEMEAELVAIDSDEWLLADDVRVLQARRKPSGVRLLPARDPYLQQRDRERLLPEHKDRKLLWRPVGAPGLVMVDGKAAAIWKARRDADTLTITVQRFVPLPASVRRNIADEADAIAPFRGAKEALVAYSDSPTAVLIDSGPGNEEPGSLV